MSAKASMRRGAKKCDWQAAPEKDSSPPSNEGQLASIPALEGSGAARILVAGIGNVFRGDDAFGSEIIRESKQRSWPKGVRLVDFGIRGYDLAFALADGYDAVILVDAAPRGQQPGTLYLVEVEQEQIAQAKTRRGRADSLDAVEAIRMANAIGHSAERIYLVGCEPAELETKAVSHGLSATVEAAVTPGVDLIEALIKDLLRGRKTTRAT